MTFAGRTVIPASLDPLPRLFRAVPGHIALNHREIDELRAGNGRTFKAVMQIIATEDHRDLVRLERRR